MDLYDLWTPVKVDYWLQLSRTGPNGIIEYHVLNKERTVICIIDVAADNGIILQAEFYDECRKNKYFIITRNPLINEYILENTQGRIGSMIENISEGHCVLNCLDNDKKPICRVSKKPERIFFLKQMLLSIILNNSPLDAAFNPDTTYKFVAESNGKILGKYYGALSNLDLEEDVDKVLDRRIALAAAVIIDIHRKSTHIRTK